MKSNTFYNIYIKRLLDIIISGVALLLLSPLFLIIYILVKVKLGSPTFFKQRRPGLNEKIFELYKFRTMTNKKGVDGELLPDEMRLTKFGRFLRSTSLDELPELLNILKGDMAIIGPRPLLIKYLPLYSEEQRHRHDVRPGLTGLAQINGRNAISWAAKFSWDCYYVESLSFLLDVSIFYKTIKKVFFRENISAENQATTKEFNGKN